MAAGRWYLAGLNAHQMVVQDEHDENSNNFNDDAIRWTAIPCLEGSGDDLPALRFACWSQAVCKYQILLQYKPDYIYLSILQLIS